MYSSSIEEKTIVAPFLLAQEIVIPPRIYTWSLTDLLVSMSPRHLPSQSHKNHVVLC
jgi:hypothetical protein